MLKNYILCGKVQKTILGVFCVVHHIAYGDVMLQSVLLRKDRYSAKGITFCAILTSSSLLKKPEIKNKVLLSESVQRIALD